MNKNVLIAVAIISLLLLGRIFYVQSSRNEIAGEPPVKSIEFYQHWLTIKPVEGAKLSDLVDTTLFHTFLPGLNFENAKGLYGNPNNIRNDEHNQYYEYWYDDARIEVGREEYSDGSGNGIDWSLYSYPSKKSYNDILSPAITKYIDSRKKESTIQILNPDGDVQVLVHIIGKRVDYMIWYK
ncbi:MAG: hypothetical protein WCQ96_01140 [Patescibacteria group bacterium]